MIELKGVSKTLSGERIFENISLRVGNGECASIICDNDEQRILLSSVIAGAIAPSEGAVLVNGYNASKHKIKAAKQIGFLPAEGALYENMSVREFLFFVAEAKEVPYERINAKVQEVITFCELDLRADSLICELPHHTRRKVLFAQSMLGEPSVFVLCDLFDNIDASTRKIFLSGIRIALEHGASVVILCREESFEAEAEGTVYKIDGSSLCDKICAETDGDAE